MYVCSVCEKEPDSHSFYLLHEVNGHGVFYSCDAEATDDNTDNIFDHINGVLADFHSTPGKTWEWIFDGKDYKMNLNSMVLGIKILSVFNTYRSGLKKLNIINPNDFIRTMFNMMTPFMDQKMIDMIQIKD